MNEQIEALITANDYLNNLECGIKQLVKAFEEQDDNKGCSLIPLIADGIKWVIDVVELTRNSQPNPVDVSMIDEKLDEVVDAIENEDYILVGDLFNYEILPIIEGIHEDIKKIVAN